MILDVHGVSKRFGGIKALDGCSLSVEKNTITALIGPNGSGKSTLFNAISQLHSIDSGKISFHGKRIDDKKDFEIARLGVSRTFQDVRLFRNLTIKDHIEIALMDRDEKLFSNLVKPVSVSSKEVKAVLDRVHLHKPLDTLATDLSYGQRKLLDLAIALAKPHTLLMLDEPVAGVNPKLRLEIKKILRELHASGETIFVIEHDMNFVMDLASHVYVMDAGSVISHGEPIVVQKDPKVLEAYLGD